MENCQSRSPMLLRECFRRGSRVWEATSTFAALLTSEGPATGCDLVLDETLLGTCGLLAIDAGCPNDSPGREDLAKDKDSKSPDGNVGDVVPGYVCSKCKAADMSIALPGFG